jgi:hypothetical protein
MFVSYFLSRNDLKEVDVVGFFRVLKRLYNVSIQDSGLIISAFLAPFESRQHLLEELRMDIEALLERFRIKK